MKLLKMSTICDSLLNTASDFRNQKIITARQHQHLIPNIIELGKAEIPAGNIKERLKALFTMLEAMSLARPAEVIRVPKGIKNAKCKTCGDQKMVRKVSKSFFGNIVNVIDCPKCSAPVRTVKGRKPR